jgi:ubiquitin carboxyl-terminal hydrolase 25/28
MKKEI